MIDQYTSYKDSRIEWVGLIPEHWKTVPNKRIMHKEKAICEKYDGEDILSLTQRGVIVRDLDAGGKMPTTFDGYQYLEPGELLMCLFDIDVTPRCVGRVYQAGISSPAYSRFIVHENADWNYYYYYYLMIDNSKELLHLAKNLRHSFTEEQLGMLKVPFPPIAEQLAISSYLDKQLRIIDILIAESKVSIEEYKQWKKSIIFEAVTKGLNRHATMKDSGISWIGDVPASWNIRKIKNGFSIVSGATPKSDKKEYWDGDVIWITPADYKTEDKYIRGGRRNLSDEGYSSCGTTVVPAGSLIFSKRAPVGTVAINSVPLCTNQGCLSCIPNSTADSEYFYYAMSVFTEQFELFSSGTTFKEISANAFANFTLPCPPIAEQKEIAKYLSVKCSEIDDIRREKQALIDDMEAYKRSLIYEVVTGKRKVV